MVTVLPSKLQAPGIDALPSILLPLAGPEEFDLEDQEKMPAALQFLDSSKTREADPILRLMLVETLLLLCTRRWGRDYLRANGVYEIIRAAHLVETDNKVCSLPCLCRCPLTHASRLSSTWSGWSTC